MGHGDRQIQLLPKKVELFAERRVVRAVPLILRRLDTESDPMVRDVILQTLARLDG